MVYIFEMKDLRVSFMLIDMGGFFFFDEKIQIYIVFDQKVYFYEVIVCFQVYLRMIQEGQTVGQEYENKQILLFRGIVFLILFIFLDFGEYSVVFEQ